MPHTLHILPRFPYACTHCTLALWALLFLAITTATNLTAQPVVDTIRANPAAVELRAVWNLNGTGNDQVGDAVTAIPDINGDSIAEVAVHYTTARQWRIFYGGSPISSQPAYIIKGNNNPGNLAVGRYWGDGRMALGAGDGVYDTVNGQPRNYYVLRFHMMDSQGIDTGKVIATLSWDKLGKFWTGPTAVYAYDLDQDGADELIVMDELTIWIYRGGPGFQLDTPTITLHNDVRQNVGNGNASTYVGRLEKGMRPGILTRYIYNGQIPIYKFWFGDTFSTPWSWDTSKPERSVAIPPNFHGSILDCDGDGLPDFVQITRTGGPELLGTDVYLSTSGKSIRTRRLDSNDADKRFYGAYPFNTGPFGYLNDSSRRYQMIDVGPWTQPITYGLSGGPGGPDATYEIYKTSSAISTIKAAIPDVTGDGWDDLIRGNSGGAGVATVYAGGPYIPRDPSVGLREITVTGEDKPKLFCWPVPMQNELNIAWHGNMKRFPSHFEVHDVTGRLVATGSVEAYKGAVLWKAGPGITPGTYILSVYDHNGALLGTQKIVKM